MKQCPNPKCIIYTRLDELPDTYLRCPQCDEPLVDVPVLTGALTSSSLSEESTSPYTPVAAPGPVAAPSPRYSRPTFQPVTYEEAAQEDELLYEDVPDAAPVAAPARSPMGARTMLTMFGLFAVAAACLAVALAVGSRFLPQNAPVTGALATQTVIASYRPAVNTPIPILPTIPLSGFGGQSPGGAVPAGEPPPAPAGVTPIAGGALPPTAAPQQPQIEPQAAIGGPAPVLDALMCARLEGGAPVGPASVYKPADPFNLAVQANYGAGGAQTVLTRWYGPGGGLIYELRHDYTQQGTYYAGFTLSKQSPWAAGDYRVDIYTNNSPTPVQSVAFQVQP